MLFAAQRLSLHSRIRQQPGRKPVRQDWLDRRKEPALEPDLPIVDPHHHLWVRPGYRYMLDDFLADAGTGHNIVATVFVQANSMYRDSGPIEMRPVGETEFVNGMAAIGQRILQQDQGPPGIVGYADLKLAGRAEPCSPRFSALARPFLGFATGGVGRGYVAPSEQSATPDCWATRRFREGLWLLPVSGLSFSAGPSPATERCREPCGCIPDTKVVLTTSQAVGVGAYAGRLREQFPLGRVDQGVAAHENVYVKVGGLGQAINVPRI